MPNSKVNDDGFTELQCESCTTYKEACLFPQGAITNERPLCSKCIKLKNKKVKAKKDPDGLDILMSWKSRNRLQQFANKADNYPIRIDL